MGILPSLVRMTSLALPLATLRESPDQMAEFRVCGEKSDIGNFLKELSGCAARANHIYALGAAEGMRLVIEEPTRYGVKV